MKSRNTHKIIGVGPAIGICFPKHLVEQYQLKKGTPVNIQYDAANKKIIVSITESKETQTPNEEKTVEPTEEKKNEATQESASQSQ